jgi:hypothetical protein
MSTGIRQKSKKVPGSRCFTIPAGELSKRDQRSLKRLFHRIENYRIMYGDSEYLRRVEACARGQLEQIENDL